MGAPAHGGAGRAVRIAHVASFPITITGHGHDTPDPHYDAAASSDRAAAGDHHTTTNAGAPVTPN